MCVYVLHTAEIICVDIMYFYGLPVLNDPELFSGSSGEFEVEVPYQTAQVANSRILDNCSITKSSFTHGQKPQDLLDTGAIVFPLQQYHRL